MMRNGTPTSPAQASQQAPKRAFWRTILNTYIRPAVVITLLLTIVTGIIYLGVVTGLAQVLFPSQANGSLLRASNGQVKRENPNTPAGPVPVDLVTASGSGLDPDLPIAVALYQVPRIATARGLSQQVVTQIVMSHETGRFLGIFGEPYVNVLDVNLALDALK